MSLEAEAMNEISKKWGWFLAIGIILVILGTIGIGATFALTLTTVTFFGFLILIGGGIALGSGMLATGLDQVIVAWLPMKGESILLLTTVLVVTTMAFSTFMSNTAAANLFLPIGISSTLAMAGDNVTRIAISIALAASLAMLLPISTPPNAIAYSKGEFSKKEMAILGSIIGIVGGILIILLCGVVLRIWEI